MAKTREIKKRIKAVRNIQRITKTMQMIATARFKSSLDRALATKPYSEKVRELVGELASSAGNIEHPLFKAPAEATGKELVLVLTSNRGLCGAYNSNVLRAAMAHIKGVSGQAVVEVVGKKGTAFFRFAGMAVAQQHKQFGDKPRYEDVEALAQRYMDEFTAGKFDRVTVVYMRFISAGKQRATVEQLLPLARPAGEGSGQGGAAQQYDFSPDAKGLLAELLPITVKAALYQAFNDAAVSEHVARMVAMKAATDNAGKLGKSLKQKFNRARQTQITTELNEIIGGAAGLG